MQVERAKYLCKDGLWTAFDMFKGATNMSVYCEPGAKASVQCVVVDADYAKNDLALDPLSTAVSVVYGKSPPPNFVWLCLFCQKSALPMA